MSSFDVNTLTLGEVALVEDLAGYGIEQLSNDERPKGRALAALVLVIKRREDPSFTMKQAEQFGLAEATKLVAGGDDDAAADDAPDGVYGHDGGRIDPKDDGPTN